MENRCCEAKTASCCFTFSARLLPESVEYITMFCLVMSLYIEFLIHGNSLLASETNTIVSVFINVTRGQLVVGTHCGGVTFVFSSLLFFHRFPACRKSCNQEVIRSQGENWRLSFSLGQHLATAARRFFCRISLFGWLWLVFSYLSLVCFFFFGCLSSVGLFLAFCLSLGLRFFYCFFKFRGKSWVRRPIARLSQSLPLFCYFWLGSPFLSVLFI